MLHVQQINKVFNPGKATEAAAIQDVTIQLESGSYTVLVGANGSGKSTLLNLLAGNLRPDSGKVLMNNVEVQHLPDYRRSRWVGRVFQDPMAGTAASLSILDNFRMAALRRSKKLMKLGKDAAFQRLVQQRIADLGMGLENKLDQPMGTLSGGQRQALSLLMTTMDEVSILLLDEPTAALDPRSAKEVMAVADRIIRENQLTALLVTHNINEALRYGTRLVQLENGRILRDYDGQAKASLSQTEVVSWFDYY